MRKTALLVLTGVSSLMIVGVSVAQKLPRDGGALRSANKSPRLEDLGKYLQGKTLTLDQAIRISLVTNHSLALSEANLLVAQGKTSEAFTVMNPTLGSALDFIRINDSVENKTLISDNPQNFNKPIGAEIVNQNVQQKLVGVTAQLPIDISGNIRTATQQAKLQEQAYRLDVDRTRNQIVSEVKGAFFDVLRAQALVRVAKEDLKDTQDRLKDAQSKFDARVVTKFDVLRGQTDVAAAQQNVIVAKNRFQTNLGVLNLVIGIQVTTPLAVTDEGAVIQPGPKANAPQSMGNLGAEFDEDLKEALSQRPEIKEAATSIEAAKKGVTLARRSELPGLNLSWSYLYAPNAGGTTPLVHTWAAQALFSVPIFDGGLARARRREALCTLEGAQTVQRQAIDQVTLEVEQAYLSVEEARERIEVASASLTEAREAFKLAQVRYLAGVSARAGISPLLELSDAQTALTLAESNQVNALYDFNSANARLDRAMGRYALKIG